uniref:nucleoporin NUP152-like isoform X2 n=1 Tax=Ciona intestinalis TaxID=7719 RepID=UPI00089DB709|nr:nucleoporin NUP152-like isoform X2 [Ciona intestinalis]|eukprot:XP_018668869.1 nucleoporin NUP152-like isoform X2 [Ciona intestinalis]
MSVANPRKRLLQDSNIDNNGSILQESSSKNNAISSSYSSSKRLKMQKLLSKKIVELEDSQLEHSSDKNSVNQRLEPEKLRPDYKDTGATKLPKTSLLSKLKTKSKVTKAAKTFSFKHGKSARLKRHSMFCSVERKPVLNQTQIMKFVDVSADRNEGNLYDEVLMEIPEPVKETTKQSTLPSVASIATTSSATSVLPVESVTKQQIKKSTSFDLNKKATPSLNFLTPASQNKVTTIPSISTTSNFLQATSSAATSLSLPKQLLSTNQSSTTNTTSSSVLSTLLSNPISQSKPTPSSLSKPFQLTTPAATVTSLPTVKFGQQSNNLLSTHNSTPVQFGVVTTSAPAPTAVASNTFQFGSSKATSSATPMFGTPQAKPTISAPTQMFQLKTSVQSSNISSTTKPSNFAFGNSAPAATTTTSGFQFNKPTTASTNNAFQFGQTNSAQTSSIAPQSFGSTAPSTKPSIFSFQQSAPDTTTSAPSIFSFGPSSTTTTKPATQTSNSGIFSFGQTPVASSSGNQFGKSSQPSANPFKFGQQTSSSTAPSMFGQPQASSGNATSVFGQPTPSFPTAKPSLPFGQTAQNTQAQKPAPTASPFVFGSSTSSIPAPNFGTPQNKPSPFAFGSNTPQSNPGFNFGQSTPTQPAPPVFGSGVFNQTTAPSQHSTPTLQTQFNFNPGNNMFSTPPQSGMASTPARNRQLKARRRMKK